MEAAPSTGTNQIMHHIQPGDLTTLFNVLTGHKLAGPPGKVDQHLFRSRRDA